MLRAMQQMKWVFLLYIHRLANRMRNISLPAGIPGTGLKGTNIGWGQGM